MQISKTTEVVVEYAKGLASDSMPQDQTDEQTHTLVREVLEGLPVDQLRALCLLDWMIAYPYDPEQDPERDEYLPEAPKGWYIYNPGLSDYWGDREFGFEDRFETERDALLNSLTCSICVGAHPGDAHHPCPPLPGYAGKPKGFTRQQVEARLKKIGLEPAFKPCAMTLWGGIHRPLVLVEDHNGQCHLFGATLYGDDETTSGEVSSDMDIWEALVSFGGPFNSPPILEEGEEGF